MKAFSRGVALASAAGGLILRPLAGAIAPSAGQINAAGAAGLAWMFKHQRRCMPRWVTTMVCVTCVAACLPGSALAATAWDAPAKAAAGWLVQPSVGNPEQSQSDGSWGAAPATKPVATAEAVVALSRFNQKAPSYYAGLSWLSNHHFDSVDATARRIMALSGTGADVSGDLSALVAAQRSGTTANGGWGLNGSFNGSALDTALALQALRATGSSVDTTAAVAFLKGAQLSGSDSGWPIGQSSTSDPTTTAQVVLALQPLSAADKTVATALASATTTLAVQVTTASPVHLKALAALALMSVNPSSASASALLTSMNAQQASDGSIGDAYDTALALRAYAMAMARDLAAQRAAVSVPDVALRAAMNEALGLGALDSINVGQCQQLTSLSASGRGIQDLSGLQCATNLTSLDISNNKIGSYTAIANLPLTSVDCAGNVATNCTSVVGSLGGGSADTPLPAWMLWLLGSSLLGVAARRKNAS